MLRFVRNAVICLLAVLAPAASVFAQLHPMPSSKSEPVAKCTGCIGNNSSGQPNDGLPTFQYDSPLKDHVGRYVDSSSTASFQHIGFRTARARHIRTANKQRGEAPPRMYIQIGDAVGAYSFDKFFSQMLPGGMVSIGGVKTGQRVGGFGRTPLEKVVMFEGFVYPESTDSLWHCPFQDGQDRLGAGAPFDVDDRGYLYTAYSVFGWGIVKDDGRTDGTHFETIVQMIAGGPDSTSEHPRTFNDTSGVSPESIVAVKVGTKYYAVVADATGNQAVWDVTNPASPKFVVVRNGGKYGIRKWDRDDETERVAVVGGDRHVYIYDYAAFVTGKDPLYIYDNQATFVDVSFDESSNLWAAENLNKIWKVSPTGGSYVGTAYTPHAGKFEHKILHVAAGHIVVAGADFVGGLAWDARLLKIESGGPRNLDTDGFFRKYYHQAPQGYAQPAGYTGVQADVQLVKSGGKTYMMYSVFGIGDVFEIEGEDSISIKVKNNNFGTANPNSKGTPGPYVGDIVTFSAPSSNPQVLYDVTWDFGNSDSTDNTALKKSNLEVPHQYTGLTTAAKITQPKLVKAITVQSAGIASQYSLTLKVPTPRVGITGVPTPITSNTTGLKFVAGQTFNDASDGSKEGHYGNWTIGGVTTKLAPDDTIAVGAVGPQSLQFQAAYGKYDPSTFTGTGPYMTNPITVDYTVLPFRATINAPTASGANVVFTGQPLVAAAPIVIAPTWTVTWTFNPGGTSASAVTTQTTTETINTIPSFTVPKADVVTGSKVTLKVEVDLLGLSVPAQAYPSSTEEMTLSAPDPQITRTGCTNANSPCKFTASSPTDPAMTGWTYAWTLSGPGGVTKTGSTNPWEPAVTAPGSYNISLKATKSIFEKTVSENLPTVGGSLCEPLPQAHTVSITKQGCSSGCAPGTKVTFWATFQGGYNKQACDTFSWSFGSGQGTGTGEEVEHTYASSGNYTVTLTISNPNGNLVKQTTVSITGGGSENPPTNTCTAPTSASITYSGCSTGGCKTSDNITFTAKRGTANLQTCDNVAWTFEGNGTSNTRNPVKKFSTAGTYTVTAVISNTKGSSPTASVDVTVTTAPTSGTCQVAPGPGNFAITFNGATSSCTNTNGQPCQPAETINFGAQDYYYAPASCDKYEWDFGDSTPKVTTREATHTFSTSGSFPVKLRVHNNNGEWTYSKTVNIQGSSTGKPQPVLSATTFPSAGVKGRTLTFTATSNMATTTGWTWAFGDGTANDTSQAGQTKQVSTITHTFTKTGTFTVRATARNSEDTATAPVGVTQASITIADAPAIPEYRFLLPVAAHAAGLGGSQWRTDVQIYNADPNIGTEATPLQMEAEFNGVKYPLNQIKSTHIYEDIVGQLLAHQKDGQGPIIITTKNANLAPMIWTRTYNQSPNGTFGQFIPAIRIDNAGGAGAVAEGKYYLSGLRHDDRYRTNVGFLNPNASAIVATVTVFDDDHYAISQFTRPLQPFQLDQITLKTVVPNLPADSPFSLEISVPTGNWLVSYASQIDGNTSDPAYLQAVRDNEVASPDFMTTIVPGVGHTGPWRSDVTIFNPDSQGLEFTLQYYDASGNKLAETPGIRVDPRKFIQYGDILKQGVLGGSVPDGLGTLKIVNTSLNASAMLQPMSFARTYHDDGTGTYGQAIPAFASVRPNVRPNKPAIIPGVRNNESYYTNIGLLNLSDATVTATVSLLDPVSGNAIASIPYSLAPNQTIVGNYNGFGSVTTGTLKIEANGNVWAFGTINDKKTKDPEYVSATPIP